MVKNPFKIASFVYVIVYTFKVVLFVLEKITYLSNFLSNIKFYVLDWKNSKQKFVNIYSFKC